ncbi:MAG: iron-sulfur cluster carrier protein ApbC [Rhodospirillaceae bacterium]|nr:iron-sulfur cluster carrier protein ApbC [Rhodospirillaceae bacterium]|tara:strand:- start:3035 stop:4126 length:1092 start_codon:yes stop_codon:yes gene_type:complete
MQDELKNKVIKALENVLHPDHEKNIVFLGIVSGLESQNGNIRFAIEVTTEDGSRMEPLRKAAEAAVLAIEGVKSVTAILTAEKTNNKHQRHASAKKPKLLENVGKVIAIASGKGGVGKSTTAVNLALALAQTGLKVGIMDADIYGPSLPMMMGINEKPDSANGKRIFPIEKFGVKCMSIGFMVPKDTPMIWRGPMVMGALEQLLGDTEWGKLDIMIIDMPPGTGDTQLTISQRVALAGAIIVSTPQDLALLDALKGLNMFNKVEVPIIGIIENMSYFICPKCGNRSNIFTHGGAERTANKMGVDFLGSIPLEMEIREGSDKGVPIVVSTPHSQSTATYLDIAKLILESKISTRERYTPSISIE